MQQEIKIDSSNIDQQSPKRRQFRNIKNYPKALLLIIILFATAAHAQTADLINEVAQKALSKDNFSNENGVVKIYGVRTNGPDTKNGAWACAKVVTIVLREAGVLSEISLGVRHVENALRHWRKIENERDLKPGDIVVWVNSFMGREDKKCTGGGNCHVGIVTGKGYFHNSPLSNTPTFDGFSLWAFKFKVGYRPPD